MPHKASQREQQVFLGLWLRTIIGFAQDHLHFLISGWESAGGVFGCGVLFVCLVCWPFLKHLVLCCFFFCLLSVSRPRTFHRSVSNSQVPLPDQHHPHLCFSQGFLASLHLDNFFLATVDVKIYCLVQLHLLNTCCSHFLFWELLDS